MGLPATYPSLCVDNCPKAQESCIKLHSIKRAGQGLALLFMLLFKGTLSRRIYGFISLMGFIPDLLKGFASLKGFSPHALEDI
jgi:hypothetical protein